MVGKRSGDNFQGLSRMRKVRELKQGERQGGGTKGGGW